MQGACALEHTRSRPLLPSCGAAPYTVRICQALGQLWAPFCAIPLQILRWKTGDLSKHVIVKDQPALKNEPAGFLLSQSHILSAQSQNSLVRRLGLVAPFIILGSQISSSRPGRSSEMTPWSRNFRLESWRYLKNPKIAIQYGSSLYQHRVKTVQVSCSVFWWANNNNRCVHLCVRLTKGIVVNSNS